MPTLAASILSLALTLAAALPALARQATPVPDPGTIPPVVWELRSIATPSGRSAVADPAAYTDPVLAGQRPPVARRLQRRRGAVPSRRAIDGAGPFRTTNIRCAPGSLDQTFLRGLDEATTWAFERDLLVLGRPTDARALVFAPRLDGVVWEWQGIQAGNGDETVPLDSAVYTLAFLDDGRFVVRADCNGGDGSVDIDGSAVDLRLAVITEAVCDDRATDRAFLDLIENASSFVVRDGGLYLSLPADAGTGRFTARPAPSDGESTPTAG
jgi:heat shock protein HslJ